MYIFIVYFNTIKTQLSLYNEKQLVMHFFIKLQFKIKNFLLNYQDFLNQQNSLMTLITYLKNNICDSDTIIVKKLKKISVQKVFLIKHLTSTTKDH